MALGRRFLLPGLAVLGAVGLGGCTVSGLSFRTDDRVTISTPTDRAEVTLPFDLRYTTTAPLGGKVWAVVDGTPPRPGRGLRSYLEDDDACTKGDDSCLTPELLAARGVVPATEAVGGGSVTVTGVRRSLAGSEKSDLHRVTLFVLDADGERPSESAWSVDVRVEPRRFDGS